MVAVSALTKRFGKTLAVDDLTFDVGPGVTGFLGPNGAGKTTTMRILLGLVTPTSGRATIDGRRYGELKEPARRVGAVLEATSVHPGRSAHDHLRVLAVAAGLPRSRPREVLELVDLTDAADRRVGGFSFGMRQRLGLAAALLGDPDVLVLDEPATGLDPEGVHWLRDFLRALGREGRTILVSSHILAEMAQTVDQVVIIDHGRLVVHADIDQLEAQTGAVVHVETPDTQRLAMLLRSRRAAASVNDDGTLDVRGIAAEEVGRIVRDNAILVTELHTERSTLEDTFLALTGSGPAQEAPGD